MGQLQIIKASAGSGKTYRLTLEYIRNLIITPESYRNILAVTFTNKATSEMKERILKELFELSQIKHGATSPFFEEFVNDPEIESSKIVENSSRALAYILHDYSRFSVLTIDKFFQKIIRAFVKELGLEGGYNIKFDSDYIIELAVDRLIERSKYDKELWNMIESIIGENLEGGKVADIKLNIVKLSKKIGDHNFTSDSGEMRHYFEAIEQLYNSTIDEITRKAHSVAELVKSYNLSQEQLPGKSRSFISDINKIRTKKEIKYGKTTLKTAHGENRWDKSVDKAAQQSIIEALYQLISMIDSSESFRNSSLVVLKNYRSFLLLERINNEILEINRDSGSMMLSRSMQVLSSLINENDAPFIYEKIGTAFSRFMIDEFQDTSTIQWRNFVPLLNNALSEGEGSSVILLGDVKQSIYGWRGGNWRLLGGELTNDITNKEQILPPQSLTTNWRSEENVVDFNNQFIAQFIKSISADLNSEIENATEEEYLSREYLNKNRDILSSAYSDLYQNVSPRAEKGKGYIAIDYYDKDGDKNLHLMVKKIEDAQRRGYRAGDIAILVRGNREATAVADYLVRYRTENRDLKTQFCYDFVSNEALKLSFSQDVRFIICAMRASQTNNLKEGNIESLTFNTLRYNRYDGVLSEEDYTFLSSLRYFSLLESFEKIVSHYKLDNNESIVAYIQALHQKIITFAADESAEINTFLDWWDVEGESSAIYMPQSGDSMLITTIHASKGLEFKIVLLPFARQRLSPLPNSLFWAATQIEPFDRIGDIIVSYNSMLAKSYFSTSYYDYMLLSFIESSNILYVAFTRSRDELHIMFEQDEKKSDNFDSTVEFLLNKGVIQEKKHEIISSNDSSSSSSSSSSDNSYSENQDFCNSQYKSFKKGKKNTIEREENDPIHNNNAISLTRYRSSDYNSRLKIRQSTRRYYQEGENEYLSPRHYGVIMHKLFERIESSEDVTKALNDMVGEGVISAMDSKNAMSAIEKAFSNPQIKSWFDKKWEVKAENDILMPESGTGRYITYRPDRVLIHKDEAIVIDYKFGMQNPKHKKQIENYKLILEQMGYKNVTAYVWYVLHNLIV